MSLHPVPRVSLSEGVVDQLMGEILAGRWDPGQALPSERTLAELLGVNRGAVREGIQRLSAAGLVQARQGDATRVLDYRETAGLDLLPRLLLRADGQVDGAVVRAIAELRACIGSDAARLAAGRVDPKASARLQACAQAMADAPDRPARQVAALALWSAVIDAADNVAYRLALNSLVRSYLPVQALLCDLLAEELDDVAGHRAVVDAILRGRAELARDAAAALLSRGGEALSTLSLWLDGGAP